MGPVPVLILLPGGVGVAEKQVGSGKKGIGVFLHPLSYNKTALKKHTDNSASYLLDKQGVIPVLCLFQCRK